MRDEIFTCEDCGRGRKRLALLDLEECQETVIQDYVALGVVAEDYCLTVMDAALTRWRRKHNRAQVPLDVFIKLEHEYYPERRPAVPKLAPLPRKKQKPRKPRVKLPTAEKLDEIMNGLNRLKEAMKREFPYVEGPAPDQEHHFSLSTEGDPKLNIWFYNRWWVFGVDRKATSEQMIASLPEIKKQILEQFAKLGPWHSITLTSQ